MRRPPALLLPVLALGLSLTLAGCGKSRNTPAPGTGGAAGGSAGTGGAGTGGDATGGRAAGGSPGSTGAAGQSASGTGGAISDAGVAPPLVPAFADMARSIANEYVAWGRVDDELRWAPFLCRIPLPGILRTSDSQDEKTHGQKLYSVFAKKHDAYPNGPQTGQVVVKQSWYAEVVTTPDAGFVPASVRFDQDAGDHFYGYAKGDGGVYQAGEFAGLYIMMRLPTDTPDTDEGWVYATLTAAGEVTAAGRVSSCMGCHEVATHERLFGVPLSPSTP